MRKLRVLFSIPTRHHVEIALDELEGLQQLGYTCSQFHYAAKEGVTSAAGRLRVIVQNALNLVKIAKDFKPDVIYLNSRLEVLAGTRDFITILLFKTFYRHKVRFVIKSHGSDIHVLASTSLFISKVVLPYLRNHVSGWLFLSSEEKEKIIKTGYFNASKVFVTKNIVRIDQFKRDPLFKTNLQIPAGNKVLLFVGRLIKEKGIYEVLEAFTKIKDSYSLSLIIVGNGPEYDHAKQLIEASAIKSSVILTGFIPEQDVVNFYANCDILVFPTYFPEGFPMALFNSVAAGLCIVTTPIRAAADYLTEPENCIWTEAKNAESVYIALDRLLQSAGLMQEMQHNNLAKRHEFSKAAVCAQLAEILLEVVKL